ncbi:MAG: M15 family metallopeptidase [Acidimicrobiales bacterium]
MDRYRGPARRPTLIAAAVLIAVLVSACSASPDFSVTGSGDPDATPTAVASASAAPTEVEAEDPDSATPTATPPQEPQPSATPEPAPTAPTQPEPTPVPEPEWSLTIAEIDDETRARIEPTSWRPGCPVGLEGLRLLTFPHFDFDGVVRTGEMIVAATWAEDLGLVFEVLFEAEYPIQQIELVDVYAGNDDLSMQANNSSAFNCRQVAGKPGVWSNHALGEAVDLNPLMNPYVQGGFIAPPEGAQYLDRTDERIGMVIRGDEAVQVFESIGWTWGGNWTGLKDYQHFSSNGR